MDPAKTEQTKEAKKEVKEEEKDYQSDQKLKRFFSDFLEVQELPEFKEFIQQFKRSKLDEEAKHEVVILNSVLKSKIEFTTIWLKQAIDAKLHLKEVIAFKQGSFIEFKSGRYISPNDLPDDRFEGEEQGISMLYSEAAEKLYNFLKSNNKGIYIKGPSGYGKTYALLLAALRLEKENPNLRVILLSNMQTFFNSPMDYMFREIMYGFFNDSFLTPDEKLENDKCKLWAEWYLKIKENSLIGFMNLLDALKSSLGPQKQIYLVADSINILDNKENKDKLCNQIFEVVSANVSRLIYCSSFNNDPSISSGSFVPFEFVEVFTIKEAKLYLESLIKFDAISLANEKGPKIKQINKTKGLSKLITENAKTPEYLKKMMEINFEDQEMLEIQRTTALIPFELSYFVNFYETNIHNLIDVIREYKQSRVNEFYVLHSKFLHKYGIPSQIGNEKAYIAPYIAYLGLNNPVTVDEKLIDRQVILIQKEGSRQFIKAICPAADLALKNMYYECGDKYFNKVKQILRESWMKGVEDCKGNNFEHYIKACLRAAISKDKTPSLYYAEHATEIKKDAKSPKLSSSIKKDKLLSIKLHIHDLGNVIPYIDFNDYTIIKRDFEEIFRNKVNILRIPESGNLPQIDFDYINFVEKEYCVFQVTIGIETHKDSDIDFLIKSKIFKAFCNLSSELTSGWKVKFFWLGSNELQNEIFQEYKSKTNKLIEENILKRKADLEKSRAKKKELKKEKKSNSKAKIKLPEEEIDIIEYFKKTEFRSYLIDANFEDNRTIFN